MKFRVVYENLSGKTRIIEVISSSAEDAENKVLCGYPDAFQVLTVDRIS